MNSFPILNTDDFAGPADAIRSILDFMSGEMRPQGDHCVQQLFESQVLRDPRAIALEMNGETLTYGELNECANRLAHYLRRRGVGRSVLVGISLERSFDLVVGIYGILKAGGAYVPLDPTYPSERLHYMATAAGLQFLVTNSACAPLYQSLDDVGLVLVDENREEIGTEIASNPDASATGGDLIYVIFTSGSTGNPKAAAVFHRGFTNLMQWFTSEFEISDRDHALLFSSLSFDLTQKNLYATLITGGTLHLSPPGPYDVSALSRLIGENGITLINCTPSAFYPLVEPFDENQSRSLASLRVVYLGGEPISISRIKSWITYPSCVAEIANTYGPTECTDICGFYRLTSDNLEQYDFVPLGRPVHNVQMAIVRSDMSLCAVGESGELCVGGAGVGAGYINDAEMTREKFIANPFAEVSSELIYRTGDQGRWHADGVIEFLGRLDHQVKIRGFRIELPEIERAIETHPAVSEAIVVVKHDSNSSDPQMIGCFTLHREITVSASELRSHLSERLPSHMVPARFEELARFPLSPNGKVDRHAVAAWVQSRQSESPQVAAIPGRGSANQIRGAWCQVLDRGDASLDDNFFDIGGDSLALARLHQKLEKLLDRTFPITDLFAHPTIRGMTEYLTVEAKTSDKQDAIRDRAKRQREAQADRQRKNS